jgi:hypothetical protein
MLAALLLTALSVVPAAQPDVKKDPPQKLELFAREDWYKNQKASEQDFVGVLGKVEMKKGVVGLGRFNPYRLEYTQYKKVVVSVEINGKTVLREELVPEKVVREIYLGGKRDILEPYVSLTVKISGKAVDMEVEGRTHHEIWPARLEVVQSKVLPKKLPAPGGDEDCCQDGDNAKELKIHAKTRWQYVSAAPDGDKKGTQLVIRSAAELVAATPFKNRDALPAVVEKAATEELAKALKVATIDWSKQMLVVVTGGVKSSGGWQIDVLKVTMDGKNCVVSWQLNPPKDFATSAFTHPSLVALVDRCEGQVRFVLPAVKPKGEPLPPK